MRIPKYWKHASQSAGDSKGHLPLMAWGWSDESEEAAAEVARERLRATAELLATGRPWQIRYTYQESGRPLREEVLDRPCAGSVITRNGYGARILNTERVGFVDVDLPPVKTPGFLSRLFGARGRSRQEIVDEKLELLRSALRPDRISARVYETHSGLRLLLTDRLYEPASGETLSLLESLGCDPLYRALCRTQECFRARLTPKPYRCGQATPFQRWPYTDPDRERAARAWVERYEAASAPFAATRYLTTLGGSDVHDDVRPALEAHDGLSGATTGRPLA